MEKPQEAVKSPILLLTTWRPEVLCWCALRTKSAVRLPMPHEHKMCAGEGNGHKQGHIFLHPCACDFFFGRYQKCTLQVLFSTFLFTIHSENMWRKPWNPSSYEGQMHFEVLFLNIIWEICAFTSFGINKPIFTI